MYDVMCICLCRNFPDHNKEHVNNFHFTESILCYIGKLNTQNLGWYCMLPNVFQQIRKSWNIFKLAWSIRFMEHLSSCLTYLLLMMRLMNGANLWEINLYFDIGIALWVPGAVPGEFELTSDTAVLIPAPLITHLVLQRLCSVKWLLSFCQDTLLL